MLSEQSISKNQQRISLKPLVIVPTKSRRGHLVDALDRALDGESVRESDSLKSAQLILEREGYSLGTVFIELGALDWKAAAEWIFAARIRFDWLVFVLCVSPDQLQEGLAGQDQNVESRLSKYFKIDLDETIDFMAMTISDIVTNSRHLFESYPPPPFAEGRAVHVAEVNGLLFSIANPPELLWPEAEGLVFPVSRDGRPITRTSDFSGESFMQDIAAAMANRAEEKGSGTDKPVSFGNITIPTASGTKEVFGIGAIQRPRKIMRKIPSLIDSNRECLRIADEQGLHSVVVAPLVGLSEDSRSDEVVAGVVQALASEIAFNNLRHVVFALENIEERERILENFSKLEVKPEAQTEVQAQRLKNDIPDGDDQLDVENQVNALADAIALREMNPPIVVGILGGWGSGKSFVLHLLERRLRWIRSLPVPRDKAEREKFPYVGHPYLIRFDAWTYAKSNLWASLMQTIFSDLDRQIGFEQTLRNADVDPLRGVDLLKLVGDLNDRHRKEFESELGLKALAAVDDLRLGVLEPGALWGAFNTLRRQEKEQLEVVEGELKTQKIAFDNSLEKIETDLAQEQQKITAKADAEIEEKAEEAKTKEAGRRAKLQNDINEKRELDAKARAEQGQNFAAQQAEALLCARPDIKEAECRLLLAEAAIKTAVDTDIETRAVRAAWGPVKQMATDSLGRALDKAVEKNWNEEGDPPQFQTMVGEISQVKRLVSGLERPSLAFVAFLVVAIAGSYVLAQFYSSIPDTAVAWGGSAIGAVGVALRALQNSSRWIEERRKVYEKERTQLLAKTKLTREELVENAIAQETLRVVAPGSEAQGVVALRELVTERKDSLQSESDKIAANGQEALRQSNKQHEADLAALMAQAEEAIKTVQRNKDTAIEKFEKKANTEIDQAVSDSDKQAATLRAKSLPKIEDLEEKAADHRRRVGITARSPSLLEFVRSRLNDSLYGDKLGLLHRVQQDLIEVTDALMCDPLELDSEGEPLEDNPLFPRGEPRIVLLIDDLDRCPPDEVVEVLEAAQLLVRTRLFVVVIAMDVRYVTRALENKYAGVLTHDGEPSGLDYIEKIVQIPYRVPAIEKEAMAGFLGSQMSFKEISSEDPPKTSDQDNLPDVGVDNAEVSEGRIPYFQALQEGKSEKPISRKALDFSTDERDWLSEACQAVGVTPRAGTRLVNVFKLMKIIWHGQDSETTPKEPVVRTMLLLLALAARYPAAMRNLLSALQECLDDPQLPKSKTLKGFLDKEILSEKAFGVHTEDFEKVQEIIGREKVLPSSLKLSAVGARNVALVHSFCFAGEVCRSGADDGGGVKP